MMKFFKKDPTKGLRRKLERKLLEARDFQRKGDIKAYAKATSEADEIEQQLVELTNNG